MELTVSKKSIPLAFRERIEFHDGRSGYPFNLDCSICNIDSKERAVLLMDLLISLYDYPQYKMESPRIIEEESSCELLFSLSDFAPVILTS